MPERPTAEPDGGDLPRSDGEQRPSLSIPDHELIRRIGAGSYGEVWLGRNVVGTLRAVKVVRRATFERAEHFEREFRGIQKFEPISRSHEGLVDVLQIGRNDEAEYFYYVMELADAAEARVESQNELRVEGCGAADSLSHRMGEGRGEGLSSQPSTQDPLNYSPKTLRAEQQRQTRLPISECVNIGLTLASALAHLHRHGLVHRDVKPSNIIFVGGVPKLADIGLVADASEARSFVGTIGFIPPEGPGSPQADLYSLGKVLYEISTGKDRQDFPQLPPDLLRGDSLTRPSDTLSHPTQAAPEASPRRVGEGRAFATPELRPRRRGEGNSAAASLLELNEVLLRACDKDVRQRYASADAMLADLQLLRRGESVQHKHAVERRFAIAIHFLAAAAAVALLFIAGVFVRKQFNASAPPELNSIAVLPFMNESKYAPHEYLSDALTDETMNALTNCAGLRVAPRPAVFAFKRATNDLRQIGERLGVRTVLAGSMKKESSNQFHVAARLLNVADGTQVWSASFDDESRNIGTIQSEVVRQVARKLNLFIDDRPLRRLERNLVRKLAAYQLVHQSRSIRDDTQEGLNQLIEVLNRAILEDPDYGEAYARLSHFYMGASGWMLPPKHAMTEAKKNALRALQLDNSLAEAHMALGVVFFRHELDFAKAEAEFQCGVALGDVGSYGGYAHLLSQLERFTEAEQILRAGEQVTPHATIILEGWCVRYYLDRRFQDELGVATNYLAFYPYHTSGLMYLGWGHERFGHFDEALEIARTMVRLSPTPDFVAFLGRVHARMGHRAEAQKALEELRVISQSPRGSPLYSAEVLLALGDRDRAIEQLRQAVEDYPPNIMRLKTDPRWDDLRSDSRFIALLDNRRAQE